MLTDTITFCMQTSEHKTSLIRRLSQPDLMGSQLPPPRFSHAALLEVDRRLQAAFRNEVTRMEHARSTDDQKVLEKLASWWMEEISTWRPGPCGMWWASPWGP